MLDRIVAVALILGTGILAVGMGIEVVAGLLGRAAIIDPLRWGQFAKRNRLNYVWVDYQCPVLIEGFYRGRSLKLSIQRDRTHLLPLSFYEVNELAIEFRLRKRSRFNLSYEASEGGRIAERFLATTTAQDLMHALLGNSSLMDRFLKFRGLGDLTLSRDLLRYKHASIDFLWNTGQVQSFLNSLSDFADLIEELS